MPSPSSPRTRALASLHADDAKLPAHYAAENSHADALQYLHQMEPATLTTAAAYGVLPVHYAATASGQSAVQSLRSLHHINCMVPDSLSFNAHSE